jgi:hypothetical protein
MNTLGDSWTSLEELVSKLAETPVLDANLPLHTQLLHADPDSRASCLLVQFPVGWKRGTGTYSCAEHALILEGEIILDDHTWKATEGFIVPGGITRRETYSPHGALAVAWFGGAPRWTSGGTPLSKPSSDPWQGDKTIEAIEPIGAFDEVDVINQRWRHNPQPSASEAESNSGIIRYQWPRP